jgi:hypothetical protein
MSEKVKQKPQPKKKPRRGDTPAAAVRAWRAAGEARALEPQANGFDLGAIRAREREAAVARERAAIARERRRREPDRLVESIELVARAVVDTAGGERVRHESLGAERGRGDPDRAG